MDEGGECMNDPEEKNWFLFLGHLAGKPDIKGAEIGTYKGDSAEWVLKNIFTHPSSRYYCIDSFSGDTQKEQGLPESSVESETRLKLSAFPQAVIVKGYSQVVLKYFHEILDFGYIDGSHIAPDVLRDSVLLFDLLKVGGIIIWDDFEWDIVPDVLDRPHIAIESFLNIYSRSLKVEYIGWQVIATKIKP
jgi:predicted O-methyltransferase YrrM